MTIIENRIVGAGESLRPRGVEPVFLQKDQGIGLRGNRRSTIINDLAGVFRNSDKPTGLQRSYDLLVREQHEPAVRRAIINSAIIRQGIGDMNPVHKRS